MRSLVSFSVLGLALVAGVSGAQAQTYTTVVAQPPLVTVPTETVQTTETVRTVRRVPIAHHREIVTTRTVTSRMVPAPAMIATTMPAAQRPLYDVAAPAPLANPDDTYVSGPLYDVAAPASGPMIAPAATMMGTAPIIYRYVYEPDRILVIDPNTGVAVQAIPR